MATVPQARQAHEVQLCLNLTRVVKSFVLLRTAVTQLSIHARGIPRLIHARGVALMHAQLHALHQAVTGAQDADFWFLMAGAPECSSRSAVG